MDRSIVYPSQQPSSNVWLQAERNKMVALGALAACVLGTTTIADGLPCIPTVPASLAIQVGPGSIYTLTSLDATDYSTLPMDTVDNIVKQGINLDTKQLTLVPPVTVGQATNYLIQAKLTEADTQSQLLPYFNPADPLAPLSGPAGSGVSQPTVRQCSVTLTAKAGTPATAGTQVTPSPDAGYVGLYAVTVPQGATALSGGSIAQLANAPLLGVKLPQIPNWVQAGSYKFALDTGTANAMAVTLAPAPLTPPQDIFVRKIASPNTTAMTITVNGVSYSILNADGTAIATGQMVAGFLAHLGYDGTAYRFVNGTTSTAVGAISASSGEGITVAGGGQVSLNLPGLVDNPNITANDILGFYSLADVHHRGIKWSELLTAFNAQQPGSLLRIAVITASGTWTRGASTRKVLVFATGGGGGGGGDPNTINGFAAFGGAAGGTSIAFVDVTATSTVACTIGLGGTGVSGSTGNDGNTTSFGALAAATGGKGGPNASLVSQNVALAAPAGGQGTIGDLLLTGQAGGAPSGGGQPVGDLGGTGGSSFWGGGGGQQRLTTGSGLVAGGAGGNYGAGGGAGDRVHGGVAGIGGDGSPGVILVLEFS